MNNIKIDRKNILTYINHVDWNIVLRKMNKRNFYKYRFAFENALENVRVSMKFIQKYKDLKVVPSVIYHILNNKNYSENELIEIIETFPNYIDWYYIYYNPNIPLWYKKQNYYKIFADSLKSYDISVPMNVRQKNTKKALSILIK